MEKATSLSANQNWGMRIWDKMKGWAADERARRETLRALRECREGALKDVGLTEDDVDAARHAHGLARIARSRAGNW